MVRRLRPEWLDDLPPDDPGARRSRRDLQRVNRWMNHARIMARTLNAFSPPKTWIDLGGGDGTLALEVARRMATRWSGGKLIVLDRQRIVRPDTISDFNRLAWNVEIEQADAWAWLAAPGSPHADLVTANLFLHHFEGPALTRLLSAIALRTEQLVACEPHRSVPALLGCRLLWAIGCNHVTRHDAVASVHAGFQRAELSDAWPADPGWQLTECPAGLFSHLFTARKDSA